jgi:hypothetical protein
VRKEGKKMSENNEKQIGHAENHLLVPSELLLTKSSLSEKELDTAAGGAISIGGAIRGAGEAAHLGRAVSKGQGLVRQAAVIAKTAWNGAKAGMKNGGSIR